MQPHSSGFKSTSNGGLVQPRRPTLWPLLSLWERVTTESDYIITDALFVCVSSRKLPMEICSPQSFINTPPSLFCIITMLTLIHSHLIAMIRLHVMLLHGPHLSPPLHLSLPHHGFLADLISVWCGPGLWIYEPSRLLSFNLPLLPSCICPSIIPRVGLGGRVLIPPCHPSLLWTDEEAEEGGGEGEGRRRGGGKQNSDYIS